MLLLRLSICRCFLSILADSWQIAGSFRPLERLPAVSAHPDRRATLEEEQKACVHVLGSRAGRNARRCAGRDFVLLTLGLRHEDLQPALRQRRRRTAALGRLSDPAVRQALVKTLPLPCVVTAFTDKALPLPCAVTAFTDKALPLPCVVTAFTAKTASFVAVFRYRAGYFIGVLLACLYVDFQRPDGSLPGLPGGPVAVTAAWAAILFVMTFTSAAANWVVFDECKRPVLPHESCSVVVPFCRLFAD